MTLYYDFITSYYHGTKYYKSTTLNLRSIFSERKIFTPRKIICVLQYIFSYSFWLSLRPGLTGTGIPCVCQGLVLPSAVAVGTLSAGHCWWELTLEACSQTPWETASRETTGQNEWELHQDQLFLADRGLCPQIQEYFLLLITLLPFKLWSKQNNYHLYKYI